jgi:hydrogenase maturation factor
MQAGKLPLELLSQLLEKVNIDDPRVVLGPKTGEDAALIDMGDSYLVAKTDPITFATDNIGWYVVQVNANDIAVMGAKPRWLMATLLLPEGTSPKAVEDVFDQLLEACNSLRITLVGGHTEITYDLPRPVAVGALLGEVAKGRVVLTSGAKPGDTIVLTKGIAVEGTSILAREAADALTEAGVSGESIRRAKDLLFDPGISVVREATLACDTVDVHAMHDPTEGGLATGLLEMATAAEVGLIVDMEAIPIIPQCEEFCRTLGLDPLGLIASGALLAAVAPGDASKLIATLEADGTPAFEIGRVVDADQGVKLRTPDGLREMPTFERDELARFFGG